MKRIFAYVGVGKRNRSLTVKYIDEIVKHIDEEVRLDLYTAEDIDIINCCGCLNCFLKGACLLDRKDCFEGIKSEIMESDLIILGSPVYFHNVSGYTKTFIDRLTYWSHLMKLRNKRGIVIATADNSGTKLVVDYLAKFLEQLGCVVVEREELILLTDDFEKKIEEGCVKLQQAFHKSDLYSANIEKNFRYLQMLMRERDKYGDTGAEVMYWKVHGLLNAKSYKESCIEG